MDHCMGLQHPDRPVIGPVCVELGSVLWSSRQAQSDDRTFIYDNCKDYRADSKADTQLYFAFHTDGADRHRSVGGFLHYCYNKPYFDEYTFVDFKGIGMDGER